MYAGGIDLATDRIDGKAPSRVPPLDQRTGSGEEQHPSPARMANPANMSVV
jgi:hypothetical protein